MKDRIYVCHTFYHVYVTLLKELNRSDRSTKPSIMISHMSTDFGDFPERLRQCGFFEEVIDFDEKRDTEFPELARYRVKTGNFIKSTLNRIRYTRQFAKAEAPFIPVDMREYKNIYVFCDGDPIGIYLSRNKIYYHALEDGMNCLKYGDLAHLDNLNHFGFKAFLSEKLNLIFIQNGYNKYCIDMEVNDISAIDIPYKKYVQVPRKELVDNLSDEDKAFLLKVFVKDMEALVNSLRDKDVKTALILTEPLCSLEVREQIFREIISMYESDHKIVLKPHPRDELDYNRLFGDYQIIDGRVPMEMLNFIKDCSFDVVVSVFTETAAIGFAKEKVRLGADFMDKYEDPSIHRFADLKQVFQGGKK